LQVVSQTVAVEVVEAVEGVHQPQHRDPRVVPLLGRAVALSGPPYNAAGPNGKVLP